MEPNSDLYEDAARVYIRLVEFDSPDAGAALQDIHSTLGARPALRAALIIQLLRMEVLQGSTPHQIPFYSYLLKDYPEVVPLLQQAIAYCLRVWGVRDLDVQIDVGT